MQSVHQEVMPAVTTRMQQVVLLLMAVVRSTGVRCTATPTPLALHWMTLYVFMHTLRFMQLHVATRGTDIDAHTPGYVCRSGQTKLTRPTVISRRCGRHAFAVPCKAGTTVIGALSRRKCTNSQWVAQSS